MGKVLEHYEPMLTYAFGNGHIGIDIVGYHNGYGALDGIIALDNGVIESIESNCYQVYNNEYDAIRDWGHSYGCYVLINHGIINGHEYKTRYAHLQYRSNFLLYVGQNISKGQGIGEMGNTGNTNGGHLHFEIIKDGNVIDPYQVIFDGLELSDLDEKPITIPTPVTENHDIDQLKINCADTMWVRKGHNTNSEIIGFAQIGYYNIIGSEYDDEFTWVEIENGKWIAVYPPYSEIMHYEVVEEPIETPIEEPIVKPEPTEIDVINIDKKNPLVELLLYIINKILEIFKK